MMKKKFSLQNAILLAMISVNSFSFVACDDDDDNNNVLKLSASKVELAPGKTATATVSNGTQPYTVESTDKSIATASVDKNTITVSGVKAGNVVVTVTDKNKLTGKLTVTVKDLLEFDKSNVEVAAKASATVTVKNGTAPFTVSVKDTKIATASVKDNVVTVTGVKAGSTTVTVTDKNKTSATFTVTVK